MWGVGEVGRGDGGGREWGLQEPLARPARPSPEGLLEQRLWQPPLWGRPLWWRFCGEQAVQHHLGPRPRSYLHLHTDLHELLLFLHCMCEFAGAAATKLAAQAARCHHEGRWALRAPNPKQIV